jgi:two-component system, OmpR family, response regulator
MKQASSILLIDDDIEFCDSVKRYFAHKSLPISTVSDASITHAIKWNEIRVLFLDIDMPELSGIDLLKMLPRDNHQTVVMVSGLNDAGTRRDCLSQGADFFLSKPVDLEELVLIALRGLGRTLTNQSKEYQWRLKRSSHSLTAPDGRLIPLSTSEYRVIEALIKSAPLEVTKEDLTLAATGTRAMGEPYGRALEVMISRMRIRLSSDNAKLPVKSLRNIGYIFHGAGSIQD